MRPGRSADHSLPSSAAVMEEYSYTSTHPLGHTGPVTESLYLFTFIYIYILYMCKIFGAKGLGWDFSSRVDLINLRDAT